MRQLTDASGQVTLANTYEPYGNLAQTAGSAQTSYGFTGEWTDPSGMVYLRARYYSPNDARFLTADPSRLEENLYLYSRANPINRIDPTGLFSAELIGKNIDVMNIVSSNDSKDHSKWGFYALLLQAESGDTIKTGYISLAGTAFPLPDFQLEYWSTPRTIYEIGCKTIMVGSQFLGEYYRSVVDASNDSLLWWRDTTSEHYNLHKNGSFPINFWDGFDNGIGTYPNFVGISVGIGPVEIGRLVDLYGNQYLAVSGGYGVSVGFAYVEGYLCNWGLASWRCSVGIPSANEIEQAIAGVCVGPEVVLLTGISIGGICKDWSWTNWDILSSVSTFYAGEYGGIGGNVTVTIPLSLFGVAADPRYSWKDIIDTRLQYGWTVDKVMTELLRK